MPASPGSDIPSFEALAAALGDSLRWRILSDLSRGQPRMVVELAERVGRRPDNVSKHLRVLRQAGVVISSRAGLYTIPARYLPHPGQIDFGHCLLKFPTPPAPSA